MLIKGDSSYCESLKELWSIVFGDEYEYINLFFEKEYSLCDTFAELCDGRIVSVLYLLDCRVNFNGVTYKGKYLYAAATHPGYRSRGLMAKLINEAIDYCKSNSEIDFISLVPANDGLYDYYGKFGFSTAFYRYITDINSSEKGASDSKFIKVELSEADLLKLMGNLKDNRFYYCEKDMQYAVDCVKYSDYAFYKTASANCYFAFNSEDRTVLDFVSTKENAVENVNSLLLKLKGSFKVYSPEALSGDSKKVRYGMIHSFIGVDFSDIYMSYALD